MGKKRNWRTGAAYYEEYGEEENWEQSQARGNLKESTTMENWSSLSQEVKLHLQEPDTHCCTYSMKIYLVAIKSEKRKIN